MEMAKAQKGLMTAVKKCPACFASLPMDTKVCSYCNQRVKASTNKNGYANKPVNWYAYLMCLLSWAGLMIYIWWVFFK